MRPAGAESNMRAAQALARVGMEEEVSTCSLGSMPSLKLACPSPPRTPRTNQVAVKTEAAAWGKEDGADSSSDSSSFSRVTKFFRSIFAGSNKINGASCGSDAAQTKAPVPADTHLAAQVAGAEHCVNVRPASQLRSPNGRGALGASTSAGAPVAISELAPSMHPAMSAQNASSVSEAMGHMSDKHLARYISSPLSTTAATPAAAVNMAATSSPQTTAAQTITAPTTPRAATPPATLGIPGSPGPVPSLAARREAKEAVVGSVASTPSKGEGNTQPRQAKSDVSKLLSVAPVLPPGMARGVWCMRDYAVIKKLYTGYASTVYKACCKASGEIVCLKVYNMANVCELNRYQIYREIRLHGKLQHENAITLYGAFNQGDHVVMVQEYAETGDLFHLLHKFGGKLMEKVAVEMVLYPFLLVLNYLHQHCIMHRDIKPENVLFTKSMQLKLADFGLALDMREERAVTRAGTLEYMAPEVLACPFKTRPEENKGNRNLYYELSVDTWAVGVLAYELLLGFPPFNHKQRALIEDMIRDEVPRFPRGMSDNARDFILTALNKDPMQRPTIRELLVHPWIRAHRRNGSMRVLLPQSPKQLAFEEVDSDRMQLPSGLLSKGSSKDMDLRTADGDLLRPTHAKQAFKSFTAGTNRPRALQSHQQQLSLEPHAGVGGNLRNPSPCPKHVPQTMPPSLTPLQQPPSLSQGQQPALVPLPGFTAAPHMTGTLKAARNIASGLADLKAGMSFTTAQNPKLQALRKMAAQ